MQRSAEERLSEVLSAAVSFGSMSQPEVHGVIAAFAPDLVQLPAAECCQGLLLLWEVHQATRPGPGEWTLWHKDDVALRDLGNVAGLLHGSSNPITAQRVPGASAPFGPLYLVKASLRVAAAAARHVLTSKYS